MTTRINIVAVISHPDNVAPQDALDLAVDSLQRGVYELSTRVQRERGLGDDTRLYNVDSATGTLLAAPPQTL